MSAEDVYLHAHTHQHADGTVHSHYHSHRGGEAPHEHDVPLGSVAFDPSREEHGGTCGVPAHVHCGVRLARVPLEGKSITYSYPHTDKPVFSSMDVAAPAGEMLAILGNNGAGKSTLLDLLAGMTRPNEGLVEVGGVDIGTLNRRQVAQRIAYVAQQQTVPHLSVYDEVLLGRKPHISWNVTERDRQIVAESIAQLGLAGFARRYCDELSGGERQKVFIARALAQEPEVLILDEPTSALDPKNQLEVLRIVRDVTHRNNLATVLVLHDINLALRFCDRFMLVRDGAVVAQGGSRGCDRRDPERYLRRPVQDCGHRRGAHRGAPGYIVLAIPGVSLHRLHKTPYTRGLLHQKENLYEHASCFSPFVRRCRHRSCGSACLPRGCLFSLCGR